MPGDRFFSFVGDLEFHPFEMRWPGDRVGAIANVRLESITWGSRTEQGAPGNAKLTL